MIVERRELVDMVLHLHIALMGVEHAVGVEEIVGQGLQALRPGQGNPRPVIEILVQQIDNRLRVDYQRELDDLRTEMHGLRERLDRLETRLDNRTTDRLLTYHKNGMNVPKLARLFDLRRWQVYKVLEDAAAKD